MLKRSMPILLAVCALLVLSAPASAVVKHELIGSFNGADEPNGPFNFVFAAAVDNSSGPSGGDVYIGEEKQLVGENAGSAINKFSANGVYAGVHITGAETPQGSFNFLQFPFGSERWLSGIAVDSSGVNAGDLYVGDTQNGVVDKFDESGHYICQITGSAMPPSSECNGVAGSNTPAGSMKPAGVAIGPGGTVYVVDAAHNVIDEFSPSGAYVSQIVDSEHLTEPDQIAVDSSGNVYVLNGTVFGGENVAKFDPAGSFIAMLVNRQVEEGTFPHGLAVDPSDDHVFVGEKRGSESGIFEYDATGHEFSRFGEESSAASPTEAVSRATGDIYTGSNFVGPVEIYGPAVASPNLTTGSATGIQEKAVTLNGQVKPDVVHGGGEVSSCEFEYGTSTAYGNTVPCSPSTLPYASAQGVSANIGGLTPDTEYHYRLSASDPGEGGVHGGTGYGEDKTVTTSGPSAIDAESSSNAVISTAVVEAKINPFGLDTTCHVQYVDDETFSVSGYEHAVTVPCGQDLGSGFGDQSAEAKLTGLRIDTVYHFRFVATNAAALSGVAGADATFATFGVKSFSVADLSLNEEAHSLETYTQAGGHPYEMTVSFSLNTTHPAQGGNPNPTDANPKDVVAEFPPGLIGNPQATPKCSAYNVAHADCSGAAQVGELEVTTAAGLEPEEPLYNLVPPKGVAAQFGARFNGFITAHIDAQVRTGGDYGVTGGSLYVSAAEGVTGATVTLWGVPADPRHDPKRFCPKVGGIQEVAPCEDGGPLVPFLRNPTACAGAQPATLRIDSWQESGVYVDAKSEMPAVTGCEKLDFKPEISVVPDRHSADSPSGLKVELTVPQNEDPNGLAVADLKDATVTLPRGVTVNPSAAGGLVGCSEAQIDLKGSEPASCPDASKVGRVEIDSPLLERPLFGGVYAAQQGNGGPALGSNPFGSLLALYIAVYDPQTGVVVKLAGKVSADPSTGQLTTTFDENPQLPFEHLKVQFFGGEQAVLATPAQCGSYSSEASLTPWSAPQSGPATVLLYPYQVGSGPGGAPCAAPGFAPSFTAGTTSDQAGSFSPFTLTLTRNDGEQRLSTVATAMPPGLAGMIANVPLCDEADANAGSCPAASQVGHVVVQAGVGREPVTLPQAGKPQDPVYLTGPYNGGPFGLSIVVPAEAGPFNLDEGGHPVVVRAGIHIDPKTAQVSVVSAPMPSMLQGVPVDVKAVHVEIDRSGFIFNPTSCDPMSVGGTIGSTQGTTANVSSRYQASSCQSLSFKPRFTVSTSGRTSRRNGASLDTKISYPKGSVGSEANIRSVKVDLPRQLPSRLSTLQKACTDVVFDANPAACPAASRVGTATTTTPVLPVALTGPVYFVSHGARKFPDLVIVLQGDGVTVELDGETFISKKGRTSTTFRTAPDVPFESFELKLPQGPFSALGSNGDLCKGKLSMPTALTAQNGLSIHQATRIAVTNCPQAKRGKKHRPS